MMLDEDDLPLFPRSQTAHPSPLFRRRLVRRCPEREIPLFVKSIPPLSAGGLKERYDPLFFFPVDEVRVPPFLSFPAIVDSTRPFFRTRRKVDIPEHSRAWKLFPRFNGKLSLREI